MDINMIIQAINTVGFPIVCCGAFFWYVNKQEERHAREMEQIRTALENNTQAISKLTERLGIRE